MANWLLFALINEDEADAFSEDTSVYGGTPFWYVWVAGCVVVGTAIDVFDPPSISNLSCSLYYSSRFLELGLLNDWVGLLNDR